MLGKKLLQDMLQNSLKDMLLASVSGMGCKGTALANGIRSAGSLKGMASGLVPNTAAMPNLQGMPGMTGVAGVPPEIAAMMSRMMPGGVPSSGLNAEQTQMLAALTGSMGAPLSPQETMGTIDEMIELGLIPKATGSDLKDCLVVLPQSAQPLGIAMGMMKSTLPQSGRVEQAFRGAVAAPTKRHPKTT